MRRYAAVLALVLPASLALAQSTPPVFPDRPVNVVVPYSPGGGSDNVARTMARRLATLWNRPVVVENMPGADGLIGARRVMKAAPDGHTLLVSIPAIAILKHTNKSLTSDPLAELTPVTLAATGPTAIVVKGRADIQTIADLQSVCGRPDAKCSWASGEPFTLLAGYGLMTGLGLFEKTTNVRYNGTSAAVSDVLGGHVTLLVTGISSVVPHHKSGALKILAVSTPVRIDSLPDVATYAESGLGAVEFTNNWYGIFAPVGTPDPVKEAIGAAFRTAAADPDVRRSLDALLITPVGSSPAEFAESLRRDQQTVERLARRLPAE